ncbi:MAG: hypothetical protein HY889_10105 [Deltaproteobacteria bacterium]|nr:hypothetical protein [Deltaproteobacteria bacterium]
MQGQDGKVSFKALFWTLFFVSAFYGAYKFAPPYFSFYMLKTDVEEEAKIAHMYDDNALEKRILQKARTWSIPLEHENIEIVRGKEDISISVRYTDTLDFVGGYTREIPHEIIVEKTLKDTSRVLH